MKSETLYEAFGSISEKHIEEAQTVREGKMLTGKRILKGKKTALIAAIAAVLLCGTAAAAGVLWLKPEVQTNPDGHTLLINQGYVTLPEDAVQTIMQNRIPERNNNCFLNFETVREWQEFFDLPLVMSSLLVPDETNSMKDHGDGVLVPYGSIDSFVTSEDDRLCLMITSLNVARHNGQDDTLIWDGNLQMYAALSEESVNEASHTFTTIDPVSEESVYESISSSGIPYVIRKIVSGDSGESVEYFMYYGYESVMYELWVTVHSTEEEMIIAEDLKKIADTLQVLYPAE